jgi:hypothetical protein
MRAVFICTGCRLSLWGRSRRLYVDLVLLACNVHIVEYGFYLIQSLAYSLLLFVSMATNGGFPPGWIKWVYNQYRGRVGLKRGTALFKYIEPENEPTR